MTRSSNKALVNWSNSSISAGDSVTIDNLTKTCSDANQILTYQVASDSVVKGDGLTGALITTAISKSLSDGHAIAQGLLAVSSRYVLTDLGGLFTITATSRVPASLVIASWSSDSMEAWPLSRPLSASG